MTEEIRSATAIKRQLCEGVASGRIDKDDYRDIFERFKTRIDETKRRIMRII